MPQPSIVAGFADLLAVARAIFNHQLDSTQGLLRELRRERRSGLKRSLKTG